MKEEHSKLVKENFNKKYYKYDWLVRNLIPKYEEMHQQLIDLLDFRKEAKLHILDLGIGTGQTALGILEKFPNVHIDGFDISKKMIGLGKFRLKEYSSQVNFFNEDILKSIFKGEYDAVISVLCIHHLNAKQKEEFFKKIIKNIKVGGVFIIADIIKFDTEKETREKEEEWKNFLVKNLGEKEGNRWFNNYKEEDIPDSTSNQLNWLKEAGFNEVKCVWEYMNYAVFYGKA